MCKGMFVLKTPGNREEQNIIALVRDTFFCGQDQVSFQELVVIHGFPGVITRLAELEAEGLIDYLVGDYSGSYFAVTTNEVKRLVALVYSLTRPKVLYEENQLKMAHNALAGQGQLAVKILEFLGEVFSRDFTTEALYDLMPKVDEMSQLVDSE